MSNAHASSHQCCGDHHCHAPFDLKKQTIKLSVAAALFACGLFFEHRMHYTDYAWMEVWVYMGAYLIAGTTVLGQAWRNILKGKIFDEYFLMALATLCAIAIRQIPEAAGVMIFFNVGEIVQGIAVNKSRRSIAALVEGHTDVVHIKSPEGTTDVTPQEARPGQEMIIHPGERIALDGRVISGMSELNTAALTGESLPRPIGPGENILAGMINGGGTITAAITKPYADSAIAAILHLVEHAAEKKSPTEKFITRMSGYYTPAVVAAAALVAFVPPFILPDQYFSDWIYRALVLLVISCPCALMISIPLGYFGGLGLASREGILIKGAHYLDTLLDIKQVVLDKTGTLTTGTFHVSSTVPAHGIAPAQLIEWAALAQAHSNHPLARAVVEAYGKDAHRPGMGDMQEVPGQGIKAIVDGRAILVGNDRMLHAHAVAHPVCDVAGTVVHVAVDGTYAGHIIVSDMLKPEAAQAVAALRAAGVRTITMLTGDNHHTAHHIAGQLNLDKYYSDLLPQDKLKRLEEIMSAAGSNAKTLFAGDGINDAPVIARADVGIAMGAMGSDAAIETADVVIMSDSLMNISRAIQIARLTRRIVWQNIAFALGVKTIFLVMGAFGIVTMWEAVFADVGVALLAILNAASISRKEVHAKVHTRN